MNYSEALTGFLKTIKQDNCIFNRFSSVKCAAQHNFIEYITHAQHTSRCVRTDLRGVCEEYGLQRSVWRLGHTAGSDMLWAEMYFHPQSNITDRLVGSRVKPITY